MAKRERKPLTQRERQCRKVAREKAARKFFHGCWSRLRVALAAAALLAAVSLGAWEYWAQGLSRGAARMAEAGWRITAGAGFAVETMYLEGRGRTKLADVHGALRIKKGQPILALPLDEVRARLEALPTVKYASVDRALPGTLYVRLVERDPVALWQHGGKLALIDDEGTVMEDLRLLDYQGLPLVIGEDAPRHVNEALALLRSQPDLKPRVMAAVRVGGRRWNMNLKGGVEVKLPEQNPLDAWGRLAVLQREEKVLEQPVRAVDLRAADRMYLKLAPGTLTPTVRTPARET